MVDYMNNLLVIRANGGYVLLKPESILWIQADSNYVRVHCNDKEYLVRETLKEIYERIRDSRFIRFNRSVVINVTCICELKFHKGSKIEILLCNNKRWLLGTRSYYKDITTMLKALGIIKSS